MIMDSNDLISASSSTSLERLAFDISMSRHPVFIGTNHSANLNDAIQKVVEFKVSKMCIRDRICTSFLQVDHNHDPSDILHELRCSW